MKSLPSAVLLWLSSHGDSFSIETRTGLEMTMFTRLISMVFAALNVMMLAGVSAARLHGALWPIAWLCSDVVLLAVRLWLARSAQRAFVRGEKPPFGAYIAVGTAWCMQLGLGACACVLSGDLILAALAAINISGIAAGISSRTAAFPRLAIFQIILVGLPYTVGAAVIADRSLFILAIETPLCFAAMCMLALSHHADIVQLRRAERNNWFLACHDQLTGLPNRKHLCDRLDTFCRSGDATQSAPAMPFAVLYLDLDGFKRVNDTFGHPAGDLLLKAVADRLKLEVRASDIVGRMGGDEFVILLPGADQREAARISERIIAAVAEPFALGLASPLEIGATIGGAFAPGNGVTGAVLLSAADQALYSAKRAGRGLYRTFSACGDVIADRRA